MEIFKLAIISLVILNGASIKTSSANRQPILMMRDDGWWKEWDMVDDWLSDKMMRW